MNTARVKRYMKILPKIIAASKNTHLNSRDIEKLQNKKLHELVRYSYENVNFYHSLFKKEKIDPDSIRTVEDLSKLPILTKKTLRSQPMENFTSKSIDTSKCLAMRTSGSSGIPLCVYWDPEATLDMGVKTYRYQVSLGNKFWYRQADVLAGWAPRWGTIQNWGYFKTLRIPTFTNTPEMLKQITEFQTQALCTLPSFARSLCKEVKSKGKRGLKLRLIFTGGEMLDEYTRKTCEDILGAKVYDGYGTNELGFIAAECRKQSGFHVESDFCIVEITKNGERVSPGEEGEITVTNLVNKASPLIRYNIEDVGILDTDKCACGSSFPILRMTQGRKSDVFLRFDGEFVPAPVIKCVFDVIEGIAQYQVIQEEKGRFIVNVEKDANYVKDNTEEIKRKLTEVVGPAEIDVRFQDEIPRQNSRKLRSFISKVS